MKHKTSLYTIKLMTYGLFLILTGCTPSTSLSTASSNTTLPATTTVVIIQDLSTPTPLSTQRALVTSTVLLTATSITQVSVFPTVTETPVSIPTPTSIGTNTRYILPVFLTTYGQPEEVWLSTYPAPFEYDDLPFRTLLFYPEQGIMAMYTDNGVKQNNIVRGCPQQNPVSILTRWDPILSLTFEQARHRSSAYNIDFLPLEEVTSMDVISFYDTFKESENTVCLETKAELWRCLSEFSFCE